MKTHTITEARAVLGKLVDQALQGKPVLIARGSEKVVLKPYQESPLVAPPGYFANLYTPEVCAEEARLARACPQRIDPE